MDNKHLLVEEIEAYLASWCYVQELMWKTGKCDCPRVDQLEGASTEALTSILRALKNETYLGDWKQYIIDCEGV